MVRAQIVRSRVERLAGGAIRDWIGFRHWRLRQGLRCCLQ
jgi:hypothetical protein